MKVSPINEESKYIYGGTVEVKVDYYFEEILKSSDFVLSYTPKESQKSSTVVINISENGNGITTVVSSNSTIKDLGFGGITLQKIYYARYDGFEITNINAYIIDKS